jgi:hypothetical protein
MRTVLSHYQTLLDDYRVPGVSFPETMSCAPHRGLLGDHRSVVSSADPLRAFFLTFGADRYPYLDLSPEDIEQPDAPDVPMGPFIVRCETDDLHVDAIFGVLSSHK